MKTHYRKIQHHLPAFEFKEPESFFEKLQGIKKYTYMKSHTAIIFSSKYILHTFGFRHNIWLTPLDTNLHPLAEPLNCPPNSLIFPLSNSSYSAEFIEFPAGLTVDNDLFRDKIFFKIRHFNSLQIRLLQAIILTALIFLITCFFYSDAYAGQNPLRFAVGESKEVSLGEAPRNLDISQPDVIDVQRIGTTNKILITALRSGTSKLTANFSGSISKSWLFQVGVPDTERSITPSLTSGSLVRLARDLQRRAGLEAVIDNGRIVIFGQMQNEAQFNAVTDLCLAREECLPRYTSSPEAVRLQTRFLRTLFQEFGLPAVVVESSVGGVLVRGSVCNEEELEKVRAVLKSLLSRFTDLLEISKSADELIETQLTFFRMNLSQLTALGLSTDSKSTEQGHEMARSHLPNFVSQFRKGAKLLVSFPDVVLNALAQKGVLRQIARPTLVIASGGKGEVQSGGELLFQSKGQNQKFHTQNYGLIVTLQPKLMGTGRISSKIEIKLSHPQSNQNPHAISGMDQSVLTTELNSQPDEQILLTRISQQLNGKSISKIPLLGHIPILGELFKSREIQSEDEDLWIAMRNSLKTTPAPSLSLDESDHDSSPASFHWLD